MTIEEIRKQLDAWEAADRAISKGKSYTIDGLQYNRQDAAEVRKAVDYWTKRLLAVMRRGGSIRRQQTIFHDVGGE